MSPQAEEPVIVTSDLQEVQAPDIEKAETPKVEETPVEEDPTVAESETREAPDEKSEEDAVEQAACFDFSFTCCGVGTKGTCPHCQQGVLYNQESVTIGYENGEFAHVECFQKEEQDKQAKVESDTATKIQTHARGKIARSTVATMKTEKAEQEASELAEAQAQEEEAARLQAELSKKNSPKQETEKPKKKGFLKSIKSLFSSCKKPEGQIQI
jgi:hypothetical protein